MKKYNKIDAKTKTKIKKAYEAGVDLITLANDYLVNYGTLRNISSQEGWIKGKSKQLLYDAIIQDDLTNRVERRRVVVSQIDELLNSHLCHMLEEKNKGVTPTIKSREEALKSRAVNLNESFKLAKDLYSIMTPSEIVEFQLNQIKLAQAKELVETELEKEETTVLLDD